MLISFQLISEIVYFFIDFLFSTMQSQTI